MQFDFTNQTAVVTGGTRGIGKAVVQAFLAAGGKAYCLYGGDAASAEKLRQEYPGQERLKIEKLDVSDADACKAFWRRLEDEGVKVEVLVNNAGIRRDSVLAMMPEEDWQRVLDVNLTGAFNMSKYGVQNMSGSRYGRIVNVTSPSGKMGFAGQANYAAAKAGMVALTKSLSKEVAKRRITVNAVSPGFIDTDFIKDLPEAQAAEYKQSVPLKRFGKAEEVASAILYLASPEAGYITGATLEITGGL